MGLWDVDKIEYVGRAKGPKEDFAFHYYDADKVVAGKKMKDWLRFGVAWWHTFNQELVDPFGTGTAHRPYYKYTDPMDQALAKVDYAFELFQKLGVEYSPTSTPTPVGSSRRAWRSASAWAPRTTCSGVAAKATRTCGTPR